MHPFSLRPYSFPARPEAIRITAAKGTTLTDQEGNEYFDALSSLWYCNVGHGRDDVIEAMSDQARTLDAFHTFQQFTNEPSERLAEALATSAPVDDPRVFFASGGSEAVDTAIKLVRIAHDLNGQPERQLIVSREPSYHGVTFGGMSLTGMDAFRAGFGEPMAGVERVAWNDVDSVRKLFEDKGDRIAAVFAEPVIAGGGVYPPPPGYLQELRRLCSEHGAFLVADEVVNGFGRLGTDWGSRSFGIQPDLITFAKGATSGYFPLGGVIVGATARAALERDPDFMLMHGHTYSGHPTGCAAGLAVLRIQEEEGLASRATAIGRLIEPALDAMLADGLIADRRGYGGMWCAEMPDGPSAARAWEEMLGRGVVARVIKGDTIAMCPPLVSTDDEVERLVSVLGEAVSQARKGAGTGIE